MCPAPFFDREVVVEDGDTLTRRYAVVIADGDRGRAGTGKLAEAGSASLAAYGQASGSATRK